MASSRWARPIQIVRTWYGTLMVATLFGCAAGTALFLVAALDGLTFHAVVGAAFGVVLGAGFIYLQRVRSQYQLTEVVVSATGADMTFVVNARYRKAAWQLFVETMTRIATQPLPAEDGRLREALSSLYSLFETTRSLLREIEPTPTAEGDTVEMLAIEMLNSHIRPFLSRWHPELAAFERDHSAEPEQSWPGNSECRSELDALRIQLLRYAKLFGQLGNVRQLDRFFEQRRMVG